MDFSDLECGICSNVFSDDRLPVILPCSHTFCGCCIDGLISTQSKICPVCRERFTATAAKELMISRIVLNMAKQFSSIHLVAKTISKSPWTPSNGTKVSLRDVISNFKTKRMKEAIDDFQNTESQIVEVLGILEEMLAGAIKSDTDIDRVIKELQELKPPTMEHLANIRQHILIWKTNLAVVKREKAKFQEFETKLDDCENFPSVGVVMGEVEDALQDSLEEIKEFNRLLQKNERERKDLEMECLNAEVELKKILEKAAKTMYASPQDSDLQTSSGASRGNIQKQIFVVKNFEGRQLVAPAKKGQNDLFFVSHLTKGNVPTNCTIMEVDSLMDKSCRRTFLDLSVDDTHLGRIIIKVIDEGNYALNFLHLCAGDLGPSYANSRVSWMGNKGGDGEWIRMGEYSVEGGTSSNSVLSGVDWEREGEREIYEEKSLKAGQVKGLPLFPADVASSFYIVTRDHPRWRDRYCFGMVEEGLDVLRDAISRYPDIERVKINDCGLIFSL